MKGVASLFRSAVGKKAVMAVTGLLLFGFVFVHMAGNLKIYLGAAKLNHYGEWLREVGGPILPHGQLLWIARIVLLVAVGLHIWAATSLTLQSWRARPDKYQARASVQMTYASRTMRWGGVIVLFFVLYHLADLTFGWANPAFQPGKPYENLVASFSNPLVAGLYIVANVLLGLHLFHGLWSFFQSLGWNHPRFNAWRRGFATAFAWIVTLANVSFPISVLMGWVH
ncbi:MAG: succinate dehydrogenase cytochrome b subunit [Acidobacteria bacterium]|nr:succinate dehydrogenase cytochrome b subunit [Acidobacteriota bacterium]MCB9377149.1 succinate dehydrogenase cytochrome b subunit [Holophagales bacterium]